MENTTMPELRIYTQGNFPWRMGGDCRPFISATVEVGEPVDIGKGVRLCPVVSPVNGKTYWVEATFGSLHGTDLESVRADVRTGDGDTLARQIAYSERDQAEAETYTPAEFWGFLK